MGSRPLTSSVFITTTKPRSVAHADLAVLRVDRVEEVEYDLVLPALLAVLTRGGGERETPFFLEVDAGMFRDQEVDGDQQPIFALRPQHRRRELNGVFRHRVRVRRRPTSDRDRALDSVSCAVPPALARVRFPVSAAPKTLESSASGLGIISDATKPPIRRAQRAGAAGARWRRRSSPGGSPSSSTHAQVPPRVLRRGQNQGPLGASPVPDSPRLLRRPKVPSLFPPFPRRRATTPRLPAQAGIDVPEGMDVDTLAMGVIDTFPRRLDRRKVRLSQVTPGLVRRLVDHVRGIGDPDDANGFGEDVDLNLVSPQALAAAKVRMDEGFRKTQKLPGDEGFVRRAQGVQPD